jgi:hypothetical protein
MPKPNLLRQASKAKALEEGSKVYTWVCFRGIHGSTDHFVSSNACALCTLASKTAEKQARYWAVNGHKYQKDYHIALAARKAK